MKFKLFRRDPMNESVKEIWINPDEIAVVSTTTRTPLHGFEQRCVRIRVRDGKEYDVTDADALDRIGAAKDHADATFGNAFSFRSILYEWTPDMDPNFGWHFEVATFDRPRSGAALVEQVRGLIRRFTNTATGRERTDPYPAFTWHDAFVCGDCGAFLATNGVLIAIRLEGVYGDGVRATVDVRENLKGG